MNAVVGDDGPAEEDVFFFNMGADVVDDQGVPFW